MSRWMKRAALSMTALLGLAAVAACGGGGGEPSSAGQAAAPAAEGKIEVTLTEWSMKPSAAAVKAGNVSFTVTNKGATPHELAVVKTDLAADKLPVVGAAVDEKALTILGRTANLDAGKSETKAFELQPGKYILLCNLPAHYGQGLRAPVTVQ